MRFLLKLTNVFQYAFFSIFWSMFVTIWWAMLEGLYRFTKFISLDLINFLIFKKRLDQLDEGIKIADLPVFFLSIAVFALLLFVFIFAAILIKHVTAKNENNEKTPLKIALRRSLPSIFIVIGIPIMFLAVNFTLSLFITTITNSMTGLSSITNPNKNFSPVQGMFAILANKEPWIMSRFNNPNYSPWQWYAAPSFDDFIDIIEANSNPWTLMANAIIMWVILMIFFVGITVDLFKQSIFQYFLFLISPTVAIASIADDGKKLKSWKNAYFKSAGLTVVYMLLVLLFFALYYAIAQFFSNPSISRAIFGGFIIQPLVALAVGIGFRFLKRKLDSYFGVQGFDPIAFGKQKVQQGIQGASMIAGGATLGAAFATGGITGAIGGLAKIGTSSIASSIKSKQLQEKTNLNKDVSKELLSKSGLRYDSAKQSALMDSIEKTGIDFSGVKSESQFHALLAVFDKVNKQQMKEITSSDEWKSGNISSKMALAYQNLKDKEMYIKETITTLQKATEKLLKQKK